MNIHLKKYYKIFLISFSVIVFISLLVIDSYSPLEIEALRVSVFGRAWQAFIFPGEMVFVLPLLWLYKGICVLAGGCPGIFDGGPGEPYFFFAMSLAVAGLYAGMLTGCVYGIDWVRSRYR